ncbi:MAG: winged helix-turn-helix transcriptional regulator [Planctomycetales bacterium]|nr:winged helix-turn-helix transcriptional regulator [bacterium]UNM10031.1 MAG: winged helix-turn-helix transcriptional regulator [Planctomycetales bacterium]
MDTRLSDDALLKASECLRVIGHPARLRLISMLVEGRYSVGELADACGIPPNQTSEHLRLMQRCGFLAMEREGRSCYYSIGDCTLTDILGCIERRFGEATEG